MAGMTATVLGASGFVGRHLARHLEASGYAVRRVARGDETWRGDDLGHAFYCIGLTADFRSRPFETVDAHVSRLADVLRSARFDSFVYLSSTRVYARASSTDEAAPIPVRPADADDLYNISKLMGESACLGSGLANVRVARLSNVFGEDLTSSNFLTSVLREAAERHSVRLATSLSSEKDYISIGDVVRALEAIGVRGSEPITNVAFGANTTHREILEVVTRATGASLSVAENAPEVRFPQIDVARLDRLGCGPRTPLLSAIPRLCAAFAVPR